MKWVLWIVFTSNRECGESYHLFSTRQVLVPGENYGGLPVGNLQSLSRLISYYSLMV